MKSVLRRFVAVAIVVALVSGHTSRVDAAVEINACGQAYHGNGFLSADLDCTGFGGAAVIIDGGSLDLRAFTLTNDTMPAVFCPRSCRVFSTPVGGSVVGIGMAVHGDAVPGKKAGVRVEGVTLHGGIFSADGPVTVDDSTITDSSRGVESFTRVKIRNSTVDTTTSQGIVATNIVVIDSSILNAGSSGISVLSGGSLALRRSTVTGTAAGFAAIKSNQGRVNVQDSDISSNGGNGIEGSGSNITVRLSRVNTNAGIGIANVGARTDVRGSTVENNGIHGVRVFSDVAPKIVDSIVTGNGTDASCGVGQTCADIASEDFPIVVDTTCDTSYELFSGFPGTTWGVCSSD